MESQSSKHQSAKQQSAKQRSGKPQGSKGPNPAQQSAKTSKARGGRRAEPACNDQSRHSALKVAALQLPCAAAVAAGLWLVPPLLGINLTEHPVQTLRIVLALGLPVSLAAFAAVPLRPQNRRVPPWRAAARGLLGLPAGMCVAIFVAVVFGAPVGSQYAARTVHWAALMALLAAVPGATVLGASRPTWLRVFASSAPVGPVEIAVCVPAHGAAVGAWIGAWPMPLDWDRPWQEWPVSCTYGAVAGYLLALLASLAWTLCVSRPSHSRPSHSKQA